LCLEPPGARVGGVACVWRFSDIRQADLSPDPDPVAGLDPLGLSDSALSEQLSTVEEAGYAAIERPVSDGRRRVRARLTTPGRSACRGHAAALQAIVKTADLWRPPASAPMRRGAIRIDPFSLCGAGYLRGRTGSFGYLKTMTPVPPLPPDEPVPPFPDPEPIPPVPRPEPIPPIPEPNSATAP
jgi:hypothetical protein